MLVSGCLMLNEKAPPSLLRPAGRDCGGTSAPPDPCEIRANPIRRRLALRDYGATSLIKPLWLWRVAGGGWQVAGGRWRVAGGGWQVAGGRWRVAGGGWQVAGGRWQVAGGGKGQKSESCKSLRINDSQAQSKLVKAFRYAMYEVRFAIDVASGLRPEMAGFQRVDRDRVPTLHPLQRFPKVFEQAPVKVGQGSCE